MSNVLRSKVKSDSAIKCREKKKINRLREIQNLYACMSIRCVAADRDMMNR